MKNMFKNTIIASLIGSTLTSPAFADDIPFDPTCIQEALSHTFESMGQTQASHDVTQMNGKPLYIFEDGTSSIGKQSGVKYAWGQVSVNEFGDIESSNITAFDDSGFFSASDVEFYQNGDDNLGKFGMDLNKKLQSLLQNCQLVS